MREPFRRAAAAVAHAAGTPAAFLGAVAVIATWAAFGPLTRYSDTWQLVINTGTTVLTFLMVFLIQNTQNRDARALQVKLDELIRAVQRADNAFIAVELLGDAEFLELEHKVEAARKKRARTPR